MGVVVIDLIVVQSVRVILVLIFTVFVLSVPYVRGVVLDSLIADLPVYSGWEGAYA